MKHRQVEVAGTGGGVVPGWKGRVDADEWSIRLLREFVLSRAEERRGEHTHTHTRTDTDRRHRHRQTQTDTDRHMYVYITSRLATRFREKEGRE